MSDTTPSAGNAVPEDYDAWLRDLIPEDRRLAFYQWIGAKAVSEAMASVWQSVGDDPVPLEHRYYSASDVHDFLDAVTPPDGGPFPCRLPAGHPSCRLDSPEQKGRS